MHMLKYVVKSYPFYPTSARPLTSSSNSNAVTDRIVTKMKSNFHLSAGTQSLREKEIENSTDHFCEDTRQNVLAALTSVGHVTPIFTAWAPHYLTVQ